MSTFLRTTSSLLLAASALLIGTASAQTTVSTGPAYANEVFYDLENGVVRSEPLAAWDIGFQISGFSSSIITNGGAGVELYSVPNKTVEEWAGALDTNGMNASWDLWQNSADSWDGGAFNMGIDYSTGNFGWGEYSMATHVVSGTTIYVIKLPGNIYKKIMIDNLTSGIYTFKYADLDGSNEVTASVKKSDFAGKNFGYYSIRDGKTVDREPASAEWDLVFGKYIDYIAMGPDVIPYGVTGVRSNVGITTARIVTGSPATVAVPDTSAFTSSISELGYDWKAFGGTSYIIDDSLAFFVKTPENKIYRIIFTGFGGSATGDFVFNQTLVNNAASVTGENGGSTVAALYPSIAPAGSTVELVYSLDRSASAARAVVYNASGQAISTADLDGAAGMHRATITVPETSGLYFVTLQLGTDRVNQRLIVR